MRPALAEIYARYTADRAAHGPCETCAKAHGKEEMCPTGRARYCQMLNEHEALFAVEQRELAGVTPPTRFLYCCGCGRRHEMLAAHVYAHDWRCQACLDEAAADQA